MSALIIGRDQTIEFLGIACKGAWFKVTPDWHERDDAQYKAVIVTFRGTDALSNQSFIRDQMREDRNLPGRLNRWIDYLKAQGNCSVFTIGVDARFGGAVCYHPPLQDVEIISAPFCIAKLGDEVDGYIVQRAFDNKFREIMEAAHITSGEAAIHILDKLIVAGALQGHHYTHEYE